VQRPTPAIFFCDSWPWPLTSWPQNKWVSRTRGGTFLSHVWWSLLHRFLPARRYASAVLAVIACPSVRLSQVGVLLRRLNLESCKQRHTIAQGLLVFWCQRSIGEIPTGSPPMGPQIKVSIFYQYLAISQKRCKLAT